MPAQCAESQSYEYNRLDNNKDSGKSVLIPVLNVPRAIPQYPTKFHSHYHHKQRHFQLKLDAYWR